VYEVVPVCNQVPLLEDIWRLEARLHELQIFLLEKDEMSASRPGRLNPGEVPK
jgi:hypothetical protein